jgi:hypothetical protein
MKTLFSFLIFLSSINAHASSEKFLAYSADFSYYISGRLSANLTNQIEKQKGNLSLTDRSLYLADFMHLYRKVLISCDGPLDDVYRETPYFKHYDEQPKEISKPLFYIGLLDYNFWPIIESWEKKVRLQVLKTFSDGDWNLKNPECTNRQYLEQNKN